MTRGFMAILMFDLKKAYQYNVLSVPLFMGIAFYSAFAVIDVILNKNYILKIEKQLSKKYMFLVYAVILIVATFLNNKNG